MQGWYQVAFERDLGSGLTLLGSGRGALLAVRENARLRLVDAACPHRGASLAGGRLEDGTPCTSARRRTSDSA
jgi:3-ketosteroid 9alpha-monooxygenase subunit A